MCEEAREGNWLSFCLDDSGGGGDGGGRKGGYMKFLSACLDVSISVSGWFLYVMLGWMHVCECERVCMGEGDRGRLPLLGTYEPFVHVILLPHVVIPSRLKIACLSRQATQDCSLLKKKNQKSIVKN